MATPYVKNALANGATITKTALDTMESGIAAAALQADLPDLRFTFPRVMAAPPTITVTNNTTATTLASTGPALNGVSYTNTDPVDTKLFRPLGVGNTAPSKGSSGFEAYAATFLTSGKGTPGTVLYDLLFDGIAIEFSLRQFGGAAFHALVNGEYTAQYPTILGGNAGSYGNVKLTFATSAVRRITLEYTAPNPFSLGMWKAPTDTFRAAKQPTRRLVVAGDSYTGGAYSSPVSSWGKWAARCLGFDDFVNAGLGGSGWLATTTVDGTAYNIGNRLTSDVVNFAPTDVIFALGHNDTGFTNTQIGNQVTTVLTNLRSALPNLRSLVVVGPFWSGGSASPYDSMSTAIQNAATGLADAYIDTVTNPYFIGTGRVGATNGTGNADVYIGADNVHPVDPGSLWLGVGVAQAIADALN